MDSFVFDRLLESRLRAYLELFPCVAIVGPRQVGKTHLVKSMLEQYPREAIYLDLESDEDLVKLRNAEQYFNARQDKLIIIDEVQRKPELFVLLRSVIDKRRENGRFILLGSASPELLTQSSESLAGRIGYLEMHPLMYQEVKGRYHYDQLWLRGGIPNALLQPGDALSMEVRQQFIQTYVERELAILGLSASGTRLKNLLRMIAHMQGQLINYAHLSNAMGINVQTLHRYLNFFENAFIIRRLEPYHTNVQKRIVKAPKIYIRDTGVYHALAGIEDREALDGFPGKGHSWESFVIQQVMARLEIGVEAFFYRTHDGTEIDFVLVKGMKPVIGLEIKLSNAPTITRGTTIASTDLGNIPVLVVTHAVAEDYTHNENVTVTSFERLMEQLRMHKLIESNLA